MPRRSNKAALFHTTGIRKYSAAKRKYYGTAGRSTSVLFPGRRHLNIGRRGVGGHRGYGVKARRGKMKR